MRGMQKRKRTCRGKKRDAQRSIDDGDETAASETNRTTQHGTAHGGAPLTCSHSQISFSAAFRCFFDSL